MTKAAPCQLLQLNVDKKWQQLISIDKTTALVTSYVKKVEYNIADSSTSSGELLGTLLYA